jgi:hypothetical protein
LALVSPLPAPPTSGVKLKRTKKADAVLRAIRSVILRRDMVDLLFDDTG